MCIRDREYTVTIASSRPAPGHFDFEQVSRYKKRDTGDELFYEFVISDGLKWACPNEGFMISLSLDPSCDPTDPSVYPVTQDPSGYRRKCAKLSTLSTGGFGAMFKKPIAPGTLFLGDFNVNEAMSNHLKACLLYTSPSPRDVEESRMPSSA